MVVQKVEREAVDQIFAALADATRRDIVTRVLRDEASVSAPARHYDMSFAAVQKHIAAPAPPEERPANMPSPRARRRVISSLSSWLTSITRSTRVRSKMRGRYSAGHLRMPGTWAPGAGRTPVAGLAAFFSFR